MVVLVNLSFARQAFGFFYLMFIPGFLILKLLKLNAIGSLETILFSAGFSIAIVMLVGLFLNIFSPMLSFAGPLSIVPLLIAINVIVLIFSVVAYYKGASFRLFSGKFPKKHLVLTLLLTVPLILSIVGVMLVNLSENNFVLLLMILTISIFVIIGLDPCEKFPKNLYAFMVFILSISLLYHGSLVSNHIVGFGSDSHVEHFVFRNTLNHAYWDLANPFKGSLGLGRMHSMLSITILPVIYSVILNMDPTWVFKIIYPIIFSFVPLCLFWTWRRYIGEKLAFASVFLFVAQETFYTEMLGLNRQMIAELFFVLLVLLTVDRAIKPVNRFLCFAILSFGLVVSHYGLSEIFLFFISVALLSLLVFRKNTQQLTVSMVILFFVIMFAWYLYISNASVFSSILEFSDYVYRQLSDFFNPASRGETVLRGLGLEPPPTVWNAVSRVFAYITEALILIGFVGLIAKCVKPNYCREYYAFTLIAMGFLGALIVVPGLAETLNMTRFYHVLLFFLAPLCTLGAEVVVKMIFRQRKSFIALILLISVLIPYFLFQTSFIYEIVGSTSWSLPLSGYRMGTRKQLKYGVITDQEVLAAKWLSQNTDKEHTVYGSFLLPFVSFGFVDLDSLRALTNVTRVGADSFVYLGKVNVIDEVVVVNYVWNTSDIYHSTLRFLGCIYSSGSCEVYKSTLGP